LQLDGNKKNMNKKFMSSIDYNKSSTGCPACSMECKKISKRINNRKLTEIKNKEVPHILKVFNF
jgi:Fe-S-cluster-containing dehydrogenase component